MVHITKYTRDKPCVRLGTQAPAARALLGAAPRARGEPEARRARNNRIQLLVMRILF